MKQVLQNLRDGLTQVVEVPVPSPQPGQVLVRTGASLVSAGTERMLVEFAGKSLLGKAASRPDQVRQVIDKARREGLISTIEAVFNRLDQPLSLGYSSAGTITTLGEGVTGFQVGQRVACAGGGYAVHAEYALVPQNLLARLPENVDVEQGAFATLGAIALHGFRLSGASLGEDVAVIGLGLLGLLTVGIARAAGCRVLGIDLHPARVALAEQLGAQAVLRENAEDASLIFSHGRGVDVTLICADTTSDDPVELAGEIARDRGKVVAVGAVGMHIPRRSYYYKELDFIVSRSYGPGRYDPNYEEKGQDYPAGFVRWTAGRNMAAFLELLAAGKFDLAPIITHRFPIEDAPAAYQMITGGGDEKFLGVLLTYPQDAGNEQGSHKLKHHTRPVQPGQLGLGVLGAGNFASAVLLPALKGIPALTPVAISSASGLSASHAARSFGFAESGSDPAAVLANDAVNVVAVLTRHNLHAGQVLAALRAGKHVFCEKPLALNEAQLSEIENELARADAPLLMVGFNRRFAPLAVKLAAFYAGRQEPLHISYRVNAGFLPADHWLQDPQTGGGRIIGEGCHFIDFITFLAGAPPITVSAAGLPDGGCYHADNVTITLSFPDGSVGTLHYLANGDKSVPKERVEVFGGGRVAVLNDFRTLELTQNGRRKVHKSRLRQDKGHRAEWVAFAEAIQRGGAPPIPYEHLLGVTRATFKAAAKLRGEA